MSDREPSEESSGVEQRPSEGRTITIVLPYGISNMAFVQALPLWILMILAVVGGCVGCAQLASGKALDTVLQVWIGSAVCFLLGVVPWLILKRVLWNWALEGRSTAITVLYVLHLTGVVLGPLMLLPMAAFVFLPIIMQSLGSPVGMGVWLILVPLALCGLLWLLALTNLFERQIWTFAKLDGRCPRCGQWRFGRIRWPQVVQCEECGAELEFRRAS
jgi:hypothetical protein